MDGSEQSALSLTVVQAMTVTVYAVLAVRPEIVQVVVAAEAVLQVWAAFVVAT